MTRSWTDGDFVAYADLRNSITAAGGGDALLTESDVRSGLGPMLSDPEHDAKLLVSADGALAAAAIVFAPSAGGERARISGGVRPSWRDQGIGRELLDWALERLRLLHGASAPERDWLVNVHTPRHTDAGERLFARYGFRPERYFFDMKASLDPSSPRPVAPAPGRVRVMCLPPGLEGELYEAYVAAFEDHWGHEPIPLDRWRAMTVDSESYRSELSRVVLDGDEIVAFTLGFVGIDGEVYIGGVGTRRRWRKRGLASLLLNDVLGAAERAGLAVARLDVDSDSVTGAVGVYERVGFRINATNCIFSRPLGD